MRHERRGCHLFLPEIVCGAKSFRAFPFVRLRRALPRSSAVLHLLIGVLDNVKLFSGKITLRLSRTVCERPKIDELDFRRLRFD